MKHFTVLFLFLFLFLFFVSTSVFSMGSFNVCDHGKVFAKFSHLSDVTITELEENKIEYAVTVPESFLRSFKFRNFQISTDMRPKENTVEWVMAGIKIKKIDLDYLLNKEGIVVGTFIVKKNEELGLSVRANYTNTDDVKDTDGRSLLADASWCLVNIKISGETTPRI